MDVAQSGNAVLTYAAPAPFEGLGDVVWSHRHNVRRGFGPVPSRSIDRASAWSVSEGIRTAKRKVVS